MADLENSTRAYPKPKRGFRGGEPQRTIVSPRRGDGPTWDLLTPGDDVHGLVLSAAVDPAGYSCKELAPPELAPLLENTPTRDKVIKLVTLGIGCECSLGHGNHAQRSAPPDPPHHPTPEVNHVPPHKDSGKRIPPL